MSSSDTTRQEAVSRIVWKIGHPTSGAGAAWTEGAGRGPTRHGPRGLYIALSSFPVVIPRVPPSRPQERPSGDATRGWLSIWAIGPPYAAGAAEECD